MEKKETIAILKLLTVNYADYERKMQDKDNASVLINLWNRMFEDADAKQVQLAVLEHINNNRTSPTIADIKNIMYKMGDDREAIEYWNEAYSLISNGIYLTQEQFEMSSPIVKEYFGSVRQVREAAIMDADVVNSVVKGQFLKQVEILKKRDIERKTLPDRLQVMIKQIGEKQSVKYLK